MGKTDVTTKFQKEIRTDGYLALAGALAFLVAVDILATLAFALVAELATLGLVAAAFLGFAATAFLGLAATDFTAFLGLVADLATFLGLVLSAFLAFLASPAAGGSD